jgi:3-hydroxyacyl-CoA dehydrogenase
MTQINTALDSGATALVIQGQNNTFSAGADITEFAGGGASSSPSLHDLINKLESLPIPTVAAISGVALGGGLELSLSCKYRVSSPTSRFGLPEVHLGIIPGAGGTQRLPRLTNVAFAVNAITSGRMIHVAEASKVGLIDGVADSDSVEDLTSFAVQFAESKMKESRDVLDGRNLSSRVAVADEEAIAKAVNKLPTPEMGGEAVHGAVAAIADSFRLSTMSEGLESETNIFLDLLANSSQGRARRHAFFAERFATSPPKGAPKSTSPLGQNVGVIGAGTMGSGIATCFLRAGFNVTLVDVNPDGLARGEKILKKNIETDVAKGRASEAKAAKQLSNFNTSTSLEDLKDTNMIVEAVFESLDLKKKIFKELDGIVSPSCIIATNTSTLDIDEIAKMTDPTRVMGMHFFSPANVMKLVENIKGAETSPQTISDVTAYSKKIGKVGVLVGNCDGFVGNRMVAVYGAEGAHCVEDGASVEDLDGAITELGCAIGPFTMGDIAGNDIGVLIRQEKGLVDPATRPAGLRYSELPDKLVQELGRIGQKAGKGWYDYDPAVGKGRVPMPSEEVNAFVEAHRASMGIEAQDFTSEELQHRALFPLVNEGLKILEEGICAHPSHIDIIYIYGYGFPVWRGGPMFWADKEVGLKKVLQVCEENYAKYPGSDYWKPSALLKECVERDVSVYDYFDKGMGNSKL